ncbi:MAG: winged helix DNA-binding domain-containing protein [Actinobacteria bacterium]|nr:winged helix DNA-binding domain-containing protein [Actinomycetota bacterium]
MPRVLTLRELNRTTLLRQLLLKRARLRVVPALERLAGLQAQWAPSPYVALWSRLEGFRREQLEKALARDAVLKGTLMRATLHLVSARDYRFFAAAVREAVVGMRARGVEPPSDEAVRRAVELARAGPVTRRELLALLGHDAPLSAAVDARPFRELHWLLALAQLEQAPEAAFWSPPRVTPFRRVDLALPDPAEGRVHLVRRYLGAYGPASRTDLAAWSRVPLRDLDPALESLRLRTFEDEAGRALLDLPRAPLAEGTEPAPVRFLPRWEEALLAYDRRARILPDDLRSSVIAVGGDVAQTILVDGFVAGLWRVERERVVVEQFDPLPLRARRELEDEARRLQTFLR